MHIGEAGILELISHRSTLSILTEAQGGRCAICGHPMMPATKRMKMMNHPERATEEHVIPKWADGALGRGNVLATHSRCNNARGGDWPTDALMARLAEVNRVLGW